MIPITKLLMEIMLLAKNVIQLVPHVQQEMDLKIVILVILQMLY